jgi:hypothetical protein
VVAVNDFEAIRRQLLSCSLCGTYQGDADLVVACEQADAAALADAWAALRAEQPGLWADRCGRCDQPLTSEQLADHRQSWSLETAAEVPSPLCDQCLPDLDTNEVTYAGGGTDHVVNELPGDDEHLPGDMETDLAVLLSDVEQAGRTAGEMHQELAALIAEVEGSASGGRS